MCLCFRAASSVIHIKTEVSSDCTGPGKLCIIEISEYTLAQLAKRQAIIDENQNFLPFIVDLTPSDLEFFFYFIVILPEWSGLTCSPFRQSLVHIKVALNDPLIKL